MPSVDPQDIDLHRTSSARWYRVIVRTVRDLWPVNGLEWATSLSFFGFISTFPLLIGMLIVASTITDAGWVVHHATTVLDDGEMDHDVALMQVLERVLDCGFLHEDRRSGDGGVGNCNE